MPRMGKRKRDEMTVGRPERLADLIFDESRSVSIPSWARASEWADWAPKILATYRRTLARCVYVEASNVAEYFYSFCEKTHWDCERDFPACRPPFPEMFIEFRRPALFRNHEGDRPFEASFFQRWGWIIHTIAVSELPRELGNLVFDEAFASMKALPGVDSILRLTLAVLQDGFVSAGTIDYFMPIDALGRVLASHKVSFCSTNGDDEEMARAVGDNLEQLAHTAYLAISFMNCKNVILRQIEPDAARNRERVQRGLHPFVRYQTIDITPMKEILRVEGGVETNGLQKALHIVRGHFATYSPDRPLFGRHAGTFWVSQHARGSIDSGVVVKDYNVHPPKP